MSEKQTEALKLAQDLRALADRFSEGWHEGIKIDALDIELLANAAEALAEQPAQQEPVECKTLCELCVKRGYHFCANAAQTTPIPSPQASKPWVGLTDEDIEKLSVESGKATFLNDDEQTGILWFDGDCMSLARAIETKLREKNA